MTKKNYIDQCLERAERATEGPWSHAGSIVLAQKEYPYCNAVTSYASPADAEFIAHARQDVPELARRLKRTIQIIRNVAEGSAQFENGIETSKRWHQLADELEALPDERGEV